MIVGTSEEIVSTQQNLHDDSDRSSVALLLIDVINDLEFEGGERLASQALRIVQNIATLKRLAKSKKIPIIYANDNFGKWQSDFRKLVDHCVAEPVRGRPVAQQLLPESDDYFVLKPKLSAFYSTTLDLLLKYLRVRTLILTGFAGDMCILLTAGDAHMRDYRLIVPADCVVSEDPGSNQCALELMNRNLDVDVSVSTKIDLNSLIGQHIQQ